MVTFKANLHEYSFLLFELFDYPGRIASLPGFEDHDKDTVEAVLEEAARFCEQELLPLNQSGDEEGCTYLDGEVKTPKGFKEAYDNYASAGWIGLSASQEFGGQDLPKTINTILGEMLCATNLSFAIYPGLTFGAYNAIDKWGSQKLKETYLPKMTAGIWTGTMNLTEPHCGTDLGLIRTKAVPKDDGSYVITGSKIFISGGEHDLSENIIHLVLAKLPDAPEGTRGISLFLVPKFLLNEQGEPGERNGVQCGSIEHKMGIKASSTCAMNFDDATGWLVGEPHGGMKAMFTMMNEARLMVGIQGLGLAEAAYQSAAHYAKERLQGRSLKGTLYPDKPADPIIVHPDVRIELLTMRSITDACRALAVETAIQSDIAHRHADEKERQKADDFVALMTPIIKSYLTDHGTEASSRAMQVLGGHGYIKDWGVEQLMRDARIAQIYEGTNGIQALDLIGRKLGVDTGRLLRRFFHPVEQFLKEHQSNEVLKDLLPLLAKAFGRLQQATGIIAQKGLSDPEEAASAASDYLKLFALVALSYMWARIVVVAAEKQDDLFYRSKLVYARFFYERILAQSSSLFARIMAGKKSVMDLPEAAF